MPKNAIAIIKSAATAALMMASTGVLAESMSFEQVVKQSLATHPAILSKQSSSQAAKGDLQGADWQRYPTPSFEFGNDNSSVRTGLLRLQQPIWAGGRITSGIDAAQSRFQASESAIDETKQEIGFRVIAAYVEALRQVARQETLAQSVELHERLLGLISRRVEQEASPRVDQELAQSRLYQANNDLTSVRQALANAFTQLSQLAGRRVDGVAAFDAESFGVLKSREDALDQAVAVSYTLHRLTFEEEAAQADVESKRSAYKPQISGRFERSYQSAPLNGVPSFTTNRVMLVVEAQTGAGLSALSGVDAAVARREAARLQRETALREVRERVDVDWDDLQASRGRLENAQLASKSSKEVYESYARQYTAGRKTWLDLLNTVRESAQSDVAVVDSRAQLTAATLRLHLETGNLMGLFK